MSSASGSPSTTKLDTSFGQRSARRRHRAALLYSAPLGWCCLPPSAAESQMMRAGCQVIGAFCHVGAATAVAVLPVAP